MTKRELWTMEEEESSLGVVGCFYFEMVLDVARFESTSLIFFLSMSLFHTRVARAYRVFRSCEMGRPCVCVWLMIDRKNQMNGSTESYFSLSLFSIQ